MKLNKKGLTLIELIISIVLITVIMFFMYRLLGDVNSEKNDTSYAQNNAINRSEIIKVVEGDLLAKTITKIDDSASTNNLLKVTFSFDDGTTSTMEAGKDGNTYYFRYTNGDGKMQKWDIVDGILNLGLKAEYENTTGPVLFVVEVYTQNDFNTHCEDCTGIDCSLTCRNNVIDDLIFSYIRNSEINNLKKCMGKSC